MCSDFQQVEGFGVRFILSVFLAGVLVAGAAQGASRKPVRDEWRTVSYVLDGDTFETDRGERVRLLDINTPEIAHAGKNEAQPFAAEAKDALTHLVQGKKVRLSFGRKKYDIYKRLLAHVYLEDGFWVNGALVSKGMAHVYTFADNNVRGADLLPVEGEARVCGRGLWKDARWRVLAASEVLPDADMGRFHLVRGKVLKVTKTRQKIYLNFGADWRRDFTVEIPEKEVHYFQRAGIDPSKLYANADVIVRGVLQPVNGVLVTVTHPEQIVLAAKVRQNVRCDVDLFSGK